MRSDPEARLAEFLAEVERHRSAIREYGMAGYATMVERHREQLRAVLAQIRQHCKEHDLPLPPEASLE